jgi:hypothetical protein
MGAQLAAAPPFLGNPARHQVKEEPACSHSRTDLALRRAPPPAFAWVLGVAVLLYVVGFFIKR